MIISVGFYSESETKPFDDTASATDKVSLSITNDENTKPENKSLSDNVGISDQVTIYKNDMKQLFIKIKDIAGTADKMN